MSDPKQIWQSQSTEPLKMSLDEIRRRAQELQTKGRQRALLGIVLGIFLAVWFARVFVTVDELVARIGWGLLSLWSIYGAYQAYRWIWPGKLDTEATTPTSLAYYRSELERSRDYEMHIWRRSGLSLFFLGLALALVPPLLKGPGQLVNTVPFFVLLVVWFVAFFITRKRKRQKLQREIDELTDLEGY